MIISHTFSSLHEPINHTFGIVSFRAYKNDAMFTYVTINLHHKLSLFCVHV